MSKQIVEQVKAALVARGQRWETNEDAFQITGRVAWILRGQGAMLISKAASQNGAVVGRGKFSHDAIAFPFPLPWRDCLVSAGPEQNLNLPAWGETGSSNATLVAPFDMDLDALPGPVAVEPPAPAPLSTPDINSRLDAIEAALVKLAEGFALVAKVISLDQQDAVYDIPYDFNLSFLGRVKGTAVATPRKR